MVQTDVRYCINKSRSHYWAAKQHNGLPNNVDTNLHVAHKLLITFNYAQVFNTPSLAVYAINIYDENINYVRYLHLYQLLEVILVKYDRCFHQTRSRYEHNSLVVS